MANRKYQILNNTWLFLEGWRKFKISWEFINKIFILGWKSEEFLFTFFLLFCYITMWMNFKGMLAHFQNYLVQLHQNGRRIEFTFEWFAFLSPRIGIGPCFGVIFCTSAPPQMAQQFAKWCKGILMQRHPHYFSRYITIKYATLIIPPKLHWWVLTWNHFYIEDKAKVILGLNVKSITLFENV